jgi:hypothetical protein
MSLRLEMLQVARLAPKLLGDSTHLVRDFLLRDQNEDGGFRDRSGASDLYYTVFALDGLIALEVTAAGEAGKSKPGVVKAIARAREYLRAFGEGAGLDFVHLCCLARAWAAVSAAPVPGAFNAEALHTKLEKFRTPDGGYNPTPGAATGTAYGAFLALGAWQDARGDLPEKPRLITSLEALRTSDGAWTNEMLPAPARSRGSTNATAAVVSVLRNLGLPIDPVVGHWLLGRVHPQGGFLATPDAPLPDLLSTATALHALAGLEIQLDSRLQEGCLDFVDSLWTNAGGFHGHWSDDQLDSEYTFYGLLALGHLSL